MPPTRQVKSKQRVADFGEVFTAPREVNAMLDLVASEFKRVDATFLDPACGDGNFLDEILRRKLAFVEEVSASDAEYERNALIALGSIYGVEIQDDNARECRARLLEIWREAYDGKLGEKGSDVARETAEEIVALNIVRGDFLKLQTVDAQGRDTGEPIYMYSWSYGKGRMTNKRERLQEPPKDAQQMLFDRQADETPEESESQTSEPREEPTTPEAPVKKSRRAASDSTKKKTKTSKKTEPEPELEKNVSEATSPAQAVEIVPKATRETPAASMTSERFPFRFDFVYGGSANVIEMTMPVVRRLHKLIQERGAEITDRWEIEKAREDLRAMQEMITIFWSNLALPKDKNVDALVASAHDAYQFCLQCAYSVQTLAFLDDEEVDEFVAVFDRVTKALKAIIDQGVEK